MKNLHLFILILWAVSSASCQSQYDGGSHYVKISPIGISDFPRDTLYVSMKKISLIINIDSVMFGNSVIPVTTDGETLSKMASFVNENSYNSKAANRNFDEYGCFKISYCNRNSIITSYDLDRLDSKDYLNSLIGVLIKNHLDAKLIKELKEQCLAPIDY